MNVYYNDNEPFVAQWLETLIEAGELPRGVVDNRSILDVRAADLAGHRHCHWFAGIGGWPLALKLAGWPDEREVWSFSCPCQPLSSAGARRAHVDERHLWPALHGLIAECRPAVLFGEQVASALGREWFSAVRADLEHLGYAVGAADLPAASVGAPHIRQRLWFVADAGHRDLAARPWASRRQDDERTAVGNEPAGDGESRDLAAGLAADAGGGGLRAEPGRRGSAGPDPSVAPHDGAAQSLADTARSCQPHEQNGGRESGLAKRALDRTGDRAVGRTPATRGAEPRGNASLLAPPVADSDRQGRGCGRLAQHGELQGACGDLADGRGAPGRRHGSALADTAGCEPGAQRRDDGEVRSLQEAQRQEHSAALSGGRGEALADAERDGRWLARARPGSGETQGGRTSGQPAGGRERAGKAVADAAPQLLHRSRDAGTGRRQEPADSGDMADAGLARLPLSERDVLPGAGQRPQGGAITEHGGWSVEPGMGRVAHGLRGRVGRLRAYGNSIVPQCAQAFIAAYRELVAERERAGAGHDNDAREARGRAL